MAWSSREPPPGPEPEAVLHDVAPGAAPVGVVTECGQRHAEIARRQDAVLLAEAAGGSAVVRHGDDRRQLGGQQPQRRERCREAVASAEGHHGGALGLLRSRAGLPAGRGAAGRSARPLFAAQVPVGGGHRDARILRQLLGKLDGDRHRTVFPAGAAHGDGGVVLVLAAVPVEDRLEGQDVAFDEARDALGLEDVVADVLVEAGVRAQSGTQWGLGMNRTSAT